MYYCYLTKRACIADPTCMLLHPHVANPEIDNGLFTKILVCLATRYNKGVGAMRRHISVKDIEEWGKVQIVGGDTMVASSLVKSSQEDSRNASYVRVSTFKFLVLIYSFILSYP